MSEEPLPSSPLEQLRTMAAVEAMMTDDLTLSIMTLGLS